MTVGGGQGTPLQSTEFSHVTERGEMIRYLRRAIAKTPPDRPDLRAPLVDFLGRLERT